MYKLANNNAQVKCINTTLLERYNSKKRPYVTNSELYDIRYLVVLVQNIYYHELETAKGNLTMDDLKMFPEYLDFIKCMRCKLFVFNKICYINPCVVSDLYQRRIAEGQSRIYGFEENLYFTLEMVKVNYMADKARRRSAPISSAPNG
jgi:hypothetical protein